METPGYDDDFENKAYEGEQDPDTEGASTPEEVQPDQAEGEPDDA